MGKHRRLQTVQCRRHEPGRNHRHPGGPITGAGRAVTGDGMVSAGFGSGRNGDCSSSSASAPISVSVIASLLRPHRNHLRHHGYWKLGLPASRLRVIGSDPLVRHGPSRAQPGPSRPRFRRATIPREPCRRSGVRQVLQIKSWARALVDLRSRATSLCLTESDLPSSRPGFGAGTARSESQGWSMAATAPLGAAWP